MVHNDKMLPLCYGKDSLNKGNVNGSGVFTQFFFYQEIVPDGKQEEVAALLEFYVRYEIFIYCNTNSMVVLNVVGRHTDFYLRRLVHSNL